MIPRLMLIILVALTACGKGLPQKPQIEVIPSSIDFGQSQGFGVYVGTIREQGIQIRNGGINDLLISSATLTGDSQFTLTPPLTTQVMGQKSTFMQVTFRPTAAQVFNASITINSNADNTSVMQLGVSGLGVAAPDGGT